MNNIYFITKNKSSLFKKANTKSEKLKEVIFGEKFVKLKQINDLYYGYTQNDKYYGYIRKKHLDNIQLKQNYIVDSGKAYLFKRNNVQFKTKKYLYLNSRVYISKKGAKFSMVGDLWIKNTDIKLIKKVKKINFLKKIKIFTNVKYVWGGNTIDGIDCSGLVQELMKNNFLKCPRDSKDQEKFFKKKINLKQIKKGDLLFWKGHVAISINKKECIHAFGPRKKVVKMKIRNVISELGKKSLKLSSIKRPLFK